MSAGTAAQDTASSAQDGYFCHTHLTVKAHARNLRAPRLVETTRAQRVRLEGVRASELEDCYGRRETDVHEALRSPAEGRAVVPLALLSAAWTASLAGVGAAPATVSARQGADDDAARRHQRAHRGDRGARPASSDPDDADASTAATPAQIVATASTNGIPSAALAAYQRAETVINNADKSCNLPWQLVAAIGRVESNHGRSGGNVLDDRRRRQARHLRHRAQRPHSTAAISDTDGGQLDNDTACDRAVGPMQFIPSTWSVVGVDADSDGKRNPQDIDDAALATAVYLCSGNDDLSTVSGQRAAVYRYNHSHVLRRPGAEDHGRLPGGRLHLGAQRHHRRRLPRARARAAGTPSNGNNGGQNGRTTTSDIDSGAQDRVRRQRRRTTTAATTRRQRRRR